MTLTEFMKRNIVIESFSHIDISHICLKHSLPPRVHFTAAANGWSSAYTRRHAQTAVYMLLICCLYFISTLLFYKRRTGIYSFIHTETNAQLCTIANRNCSHSCGFWQSAKLWTDWSLKCLDYWDCTYFSF